MQYQKQKKILSPLRPHQSSGSSIVNQKVVSQSQRTYSKSRKNQSQDSLSRTLQVQNQNKQKVSKQTKQNSSNQSSQKSVQDYRERSHYQIQNNINQVLDYEDENNLAQENEMLKHEIQMLHALIQQAFPVISKITEEFDESCQDTSLYLQKIQESQAINGTQNLINQKTRQLVESPDLCDLDETDEILVTEFKNPLPIDKSCGKTNNNQQMNLSDTNTSSIVFQNPIYTIQKRGKLNDLNKASKNFNLPLNMDSKNLSKKELITMKSNNIEELQKLKQIIQKLNDVQVISKDKLVQVSSQSQASTFRNEFSTGGFRNSFRNLNNKAVNTQYQTNQFSQFSVMTEDIDILSNRDRQMIDPNFQIQQEALNSPFEKFKNRNQYKRESYPTSNKKNDQVLRTHLQASEVPKIDIGDAQDDHQLSQMSFTSFSSTASMILQEKENLLNELQIDLPRFQLDDKFNLENLQFAHQIREINLDDQSISKIECSNIKDFFTKAPEAKFVDNYQPIQPTQHHFTSMDQEPTISVNNQIILDNNSLTILEQSLNEYGNKNPTTYNNIKEQSTENEVQESQTLSKVFSERTNYVASEKVNTSVEIIPLQYVPQKEQKPVLYKIEDDLMQKPLQLKQNKLRIIEKTNEYTDVENVAPQTKNNVQVIVRQTMQRSMSIEQLNKNQFACELTLSTPRLNTYEHQTISHEEKKQNLIKLNQELIRRSKSFCKNQDIPQIENLDESYKEIGSILTQNYKQKPQNPEIQVSENTIEKDRLQVQNSQLMVFKYSPIRFDNTIENTQMLEFQTPLKLLSSRNDINQHKRSLSKDRIKSFAEGLKTARCSEIGNNIQNNLRNSFLVNEDQESLSPTVNNEYQNFNINEQKSPISTDYMISSLIKNEECTQNKYMNHLNTYSNITSSLKNNILSSPQRVQIETMLETFLKENILQKEKQQQSQFSQRDFQSTIDVNLHSKKLSYQALDELKTQRVDTCGNNNDTLVLRNQSSHKTLSQSSSQKQYQYCQAPDLTISPIKQLQYKVQDAIKEETGEDTESLLVSIGSERRQGHQQVEVQEISIERENFQMFKPEAEKTQSFKESQGICQKKEEYDQYKRFFTPLREQIQQMNILGNETTSNQMPPKSSFSTLQLSKELNKSTDKLNSIYSKTSHLNSSFRRPPISSSQILSPNTETSQSQKPSVQERVQEVQKRRQQLDLQKIEKLQQKLDNKKNQSEVASNVFNSNNQFDYTPQPQQLLITQSTPIQAETIVVNSQRYHTGSVNSINSPMNQCSQERLRFQSRSRLESADKKRQNDTRLKEAQSKKESIVEFKQSEIEQKIKDKDEKISQLIKKKKDQEQKIRLRIQKKEANMPIERVPYFKDSTIKLRAVCNFQTIDSGNNNNDVVCSSQVNNEIVIKKLHSEKKPKFIIKKSLISIAGDQLKSERQDLKPQKEGIVFSPIKNDYYPTQRDKEFLKKIEEQCYSRRKRQRQNTIQC